MSKRRSGPRRGSRKSSAPRANALCAQVQRELEACIGELSDDRLAGLDVEVVVPNPNVSRMLVVLRHHGEQDESMRSDALFALRGAEGLLRSRIAGAIHRKRTPHLTFAVLDRESVPADEIERNP